MEFVLRCNDLKCRAQLHDQAVVTTCRCVNNLKMALTLSSHHIVMSSVRNAPTPLVCQYQKMRTGAVQHVVQNYTTRTMWSWPASIPQKITRPVC